MKMKKLILISLSMTLTMLMLAVSVQGQKKYVNNALAWGEKGEKLDTALALLDLALKDEKTKDWAKTYYARGIVFKAISTTENEEFKGLCEYPLIDATNNFEKALTADGVGSIKTVLELAMVNLPNELVNTAINFYNVEDYKSAFRFFERTYLLKNTELFDEEIDTAVIYNTALMAQRAEDFDNAIKYYKMAAEYNYGKGDTYYLLADSYKSKGNNENYLNTLKIGFKKYPDNENLFGNLINYYLTESENPNEALEYLDYAIAVKPNNATLYSGKAIFFDKIGKKESAIENYNKAIELDSEFFEAYYNLGVLFFNEGVELTDEANQIKDNAKYALAKEKADKKFEESLPYLEKAFEIDPKDIGLANTLKTLYYRLQMNDKYEELNKKMGE